MEKKHIISLGGELASGKGSVSKVLMKRLNYGVYKNGDYFRKLARESGMDVTSFNIYVKEHPEVDRDIENSAAEYAKTHDNFIIDARLGWYFRNEYLERRFRLTFCRILGKITDANRRGKRIVYVWNASERRRLVKAFAGTH